ncbi:MAG: hypothetical protein ACR2LE_08635 [Nocardioidaceae bacterium]
MNAEGLGQVNLRLPLPVPLHDAIPLLPAESSHPGDVRRYRDDLP